MERFCPHCDVITEVIGFDRDNPVLLCGHSLEVGMQAESLASLFDRATRDHAVKIMREDDISYKTAYQKVLALF